jgi:hypothetical protein
MIWPWRTLTPMARKPSPLQSFILAQPRALPAADVVDAARKAGLKVSAAYVYIVRSRSRTQRASPATTHRRTTAEQQLIDAALGIGVTRADALLRSIRARAHALA